MSDEKIKHLEMVQNIITRMNTNSFQIKGWCITVVSALLGFYANNSNFKFIIVGLFATILFWLLDTFYLQQERRFRALYSDITDDKIQIFKMSINQYIECKNNYIYVMFSKTLITMYGFIGHLFAYFVNFYILLRSI